jgi:dTDP-4-amino-4,6-dideoxygalactose transaminase
MARINVTKAYLPDKEKYLKYIDAIWESAYLTNNGPILRELEYELEKYFGLNNLLVCANGTIVLQIALKALGITKEVITTPFSYVATVNSIIWENCVPVFVDIEPENMCIDADRIEMAITENTEAILCTHVYGLPCDIEKIEKIAKKYNIKVIYDAAHAFGCEYNNQSLLAYGDISTCSFHATKLFHTVEGGCIIVNNNPDVFKEVYNYRQFGHIGDNYFSAGINGKNSEIHAAMGLCILPDIGSIISERKKISQLYDATLNSRLKHLSVKKQSFKYNYSYYPVIFETESQLLKVKTTLEKNDIYPRRYFYPSLNTLLFVKKYSISCKVSEDLSVRVLCLPLYVGLTEEQVHLIVSIINKNL